MNKQDAFDFVRRLRNAQNAEGMPTFMDHEVEAIMEPHLREELAAAEKANAAMTGGQPGKWKWEGITIETLEHWFKYHPPTAAQQELYVQLRNAALAFAKVVVGCTPTSPDQTAAIRKIREAVMTANAAIACGGK